MTVRPLHDDDLAQVDAVQRAAYVAALHEDINLFRRILRAGGDFCFVHDDAGAIRAYVLAYPTDASRVEFASGPLEKDGGDALYIHDLCVHPDARGRGIANDLLACVRRAAIDRGVAAMIGVAVQNSDGFWRRQGFAIGRDYQYRGEQGRVMTHALSPT